jgi:NAD(P)H-flavin reductase
MTTNLSCLSPSLSISLGASFPSFPSSNPPSRPFFLSLSFLGYVQQGLAGDEIRSPEKTAALLCGMKDMTNLSSHVLKEKGVSPERILFNF